MLSRMLREKANDGEGASSIGTNQRSRHGPGVLFGKMPAKLEATSAFRMTEQALHRWGGWEGSLCHLHTEQVLLARGGDRQVGLPALGLRGRQCWRPVPAGTSM